MATKAQRKAQEKGTRVQTVSVPISPPAYAVRQQTGLTLPTNPKALMEGLGGATLGAGTTALLITILPPDRKWIGAIVSGLFGGIGVLTSPIGTWMQEASGAAFASATFYFFLDLTGQAPGQTPTIGG